MQTIEVRTPCRLHFGLLALSRTGDQRQYGGAGVMVQQPDIVVRITHQPEQAGFAVSGPMAQEALALAQQFTRQARLDGLFTPIHGGQIVVGRAPRPHTGLGTGTQLGMAIARALSQLAGQDPLEVPALATLVGRGRRSAIGAYGFGQGGFLVEGGKLDPDRLSPLLLRHDFPSQWRLVLICPRRLLGLAGTREVRAFAQMEDIDAAATGQMCRLVLLGLTPAIIEEDLSLFGQALYELQRTVGQCFASVQGGIYADPGLEDMVLQIRAWGVQGVGQSSWGPTIYAVTGDADRAAYLVTQLRERFDLAEDEVTITAADNQGGSWRGLEMK